MKIKLTLIVCFLIFYLGFSCVSKQTTPNETVSKTETAVPPENPCPPETRPFPSYDANFAPSEEWCKNNSDKKVFQLSQNYRQAGKKINEELPWKKFAAKTEDFKTNWKAYLFAALRYAYEGNIEKDWVAQENERRKWFHAPWMHFGDNGREFVHGLTRERGSCVNELTLGEKCEDGEKRDIENWAVSVYNEPGAYYFKQVWQEMYNDELDAAKAKANPNPKNFGEEGFPEGTVAVKLLFTAAEVDYLETSVVWEADIKRGQAPPQKMRLLQIDIAVKDNVSPTGWILGTFIYHDDAPEMQYSPNLAPEKKVWLKMVPVGLMFGNDAGEFPEIKEPLESFLNESIPVKQHYGCKNRLNGPVDNYKSSCLSCHAAAEVAQDFKRIKPNPNCSSQKDIDYFFRNINPASKNEDERTFTKSTAQRKIYSLDYSLQLKIGIERCCQANVCKCAAKPSATQTPLEVTK